MDLKPYVGKKVMVQFKPGVGYALVCAGPHGPQPAAVKTKDGDQPVVLPYVGGVVVETPSGVVLEIVDQAGQKGGKVQIGIDPELVGFVSECIEPSPLILHG